MVRAFDAYRVAMRAYVESREAAGGDSALGYITDALKDFTLSPLRPLSSWSAAADEAVLAAAMIAPVIAAAEAVVQEVEDR